MATNYIDLFDRAARISPDAPALQDDTGTLTYAQCQTLTWKLAHALIATGFRPSTRAATLSPNTSLAQLSILGALRAGGAWCNINVRNSAPVNTDLLHRGKVEVLFFHSSALAAAKEIRGGTPSLRQLICLDRDLDGFPSIETFCRDAPATEIVVRLKEDEIGFQGSTGGTTGKTKLVRSGPDFLGMNVLGFMLSVPMERPPVNVALAPITHAGGIVSITVLAMGGKVIMMPAPDLGGLLKLIPQEKVSWIFLPPTVIYMLINHPDAAKTDFSSLRYVMSAAAPIATEKIAAAVRTFGPVVCQSYGQTESGFPVTFMPKEIVAEALRDPTKAHRLKSAGFPTPNMAAVEVMDDAGKLLGPNQVGEIVVKGPTVMIDYVDDPAETEAIKAHGWHHTGDVGYRDEIGLVYISDRKRDLIISGGFNVFPLDVEQVLAMHPAVQDSAVIGVPDEKWGEAVKAVVELAPGKTVTEAELIAHCKAKLGAVQAPKTIDFIPVLPRSAVGKVLKRELRATYWADRKTQI